MIVEEIKEDGDLLSAQCTVHWMNREHVTLQEDGIFHVTNEDIIHRDTPFHVRKSQMNLS